MQWTYSVLYSFRRKLFGLDVNSLDLNSFMLINFLAVTPQIGQRWFDLVSV